MGLKILNEENSVIFMRVHVLLVQFQGTIDLLLQYNNYGHVYRYILVATIDQILIFVTQSM